MPTVHLLVEGKVQGVFYRASAKEMADELGLSGWVKNREDGNVEMIVSGEESKINEFIKWCHKGPRRAVVTNVIVTPQEDGSFTRFEVVR
ncbi:MAG: acylphosphatase [Ilyomonas sp.]